LPAWWWSCHDADGDVTPDQAAAGYLATLR
jgi:hypothetical protein